MREGIEGTGGSQIKKATLTDVLEFGIDDLLAMQIA